MDEKIIRVTVTGGTNVGKTAVVEFLSRCLLQAGIPAVFDQKSFNVVEGGPLTTEETMDRINSLADAGDRLVVFEETRDTDAETLLNLLKSSMAGEVVSDKVVEDFTHRIRDKIAIPASAQKKLYKYRQDLQS